MRLRGVWLFLWYWGCPLLEIPKRIFWVWIFTVILKVGFPRVCFLGWDFHYNILENYSSPLFCFFSSLYSEPSFCPAGYIKYYGDKVGLVAAVYVRMGAAYHRLDQQDLAVQCLDYADNIYR